MNYILSNEAKNDLELIWNYTFENWSREQADRYLRLIFQEINYLLVSPSSGKSYSHVRKGYIRSKVKSHLIFYKINKKKNILEIIRILHEKMDIDTILNE